MRFIANLRIIREDTFHGKWRGCRKRIREPKWDRIRKFDISCRHIRWGIILQYIILTSGQ